MQLAIVQNPHTKDPKSLWKDLEDPDDNRYLNPQFDEAGFERLKTELRKNPRMMVK